MFELLGAYKELVKLGVDAKKRSRELRDFYRANSVNVLRREGWFDFMAKPRTIANIADHFGYTDIDFLTKYLEAYAQDDILIKEDGTYMTNGIVNEYPIVPLDIFGPGLVQIVADAAKAIPGRLKGNYRTFSDEMNLFNWDDSLGLKLYEQIRRAAFKFSGAIKKRGTFIDVGCGNGFGTASMWCYYYKNGAFEKGPPLKMYALEHDPALKQIAETEFSMYASRILGIDKSKIDALKEHHPQFTQGTAENLPFDDEFYDLVYSSQVLHWCDAERATKEMMRVLKPGGMFFGTQVFSPMLDNYIELFVLLNEGADGTIKKEDFLRWVTEAGASEAKAATPAGLFKVLKN
jgi:ubiquinone/menaquinone biosynthesis C-methylase UbiE